MGILPIATRVPSYSRAYVFGSVLTSSAPDDFDLVIVYDQVQCQPSEAYARHANLIREIKGAFGLPVHLTLLTTREAKSVEIFKRISAVPLDEALRELTNRFIGRPTAAGELNRYVIENEEPKNSFLYRRQPILRQKKNNTGLISNNSKVNYGYH